MVEQEVYQLPVIPYLQMRFRLSALEDARLPPFKGSMLRGAFGNALRRTVCVMGHEQACLDCMLNRQCVNAKIFETPIFDPPPHFFKGLKTAPKPFILDCPDQKTEFQKGEALEFSMTLVGKAHEQHPFVIYSVQTMVKKGLGAKRYKFQLDEVLHLDQQQNWQQLYEGKSGKLQTVPQPLDTNNGLLQEPVEKLKIQFITPLRLKFNSHYGKEFNFRMLIFKMLRRILEMAFFHVPDAEINWEFRSLLDKASQINITNSHLHWQDLKRYSSRQKTEMTLGGFIGDMTLEGELKTFIPLLQASEILHVGKGTTFGLGRVKVNLDEQ